MAWRNDWLWALPPDSSCDEVEDVLRRMRWRCWLGHRWESYGSEHVRCCRCGIVRHRVNASNVAAGVDNGCCPGPLLSRLRKVRRIVGTIHAMLRRVWTPRR